MTGAEPTQAERLERAVLETLNQRHGTAYVLWVSDLIDDPAGMGPADVAEQEGVPATPAFADVIASAYRRAGEGPHADDVAAYENAMGRRGRT